MIDTFIEAILIRKNGKQSRIEYKKPRKCTPDNFVAICNRFKIQTPEWNEYSNQFEFDDSLYYGNENYAPEQLLLVDSQGFFIEKMTSESEEEEEEE